MDHPSIAVFDGRIPSQANRPPQEAFARLVPYDLRFLKHKVQEYQHLKQEIVELEREVLINGGGEKKMSPENTSKRR